MSGFVPPIQAQTLNPVYVLYTIVPAVNALNGHLLLPEVEPTHGFGHARDR